MTIITEKKAYLSHISTISVDITLKLITELESHLLCDSEDKARESTNMLSVMSGPHSLRCEEN